MTIYLQVIVLTSFLILQSKIIKMRTYNQLLSLKNYHLKKQLAFLRVKKGKKNKKNKKKSKLF